MSGGMAMFQSELRSALREAREPPSHQAQSKAAPKPARAPVVIEARPVRATTTRAIAPAPAESPTPAAPKRTVVRLWLPLTPLWILLAPFALLLAPLMLLAPQARGVAPFRTAFALGAVLIALSGTDVAVDTRDALVRIRIF
jgi:hypothetical protein